MIQDKKEIVSGFAHVGVFVGNIERSVAFYKNTLHFDCFHRAEMERQDGIIRYAFIKNGACVIELIEKPNTEQKKDGPVSHIALYVDDIDAAMARLKSMGIQFEKDEPVILPMVFNGLKFAMFRGPDGECLEIIQLL